MLYNRKVKKIIILAVLLAVAMATMPVFLASAAKLDEVKTTTVKANCVAAQSAIQRIGRSDMTSRINRGRDYDTILKMFYAMNARAAANGITEPKLSNITKQFENELSAMRSSWNNYSGKYKETSTAINCEQQPQIFYDSLEATRQTRKDLSNSVKKLNKLIDDYKNTVGNLAL